MDGEEETWKQTGWESECEELVRKQSECEELEGSSVRRMEKYECIYYERNRFLFVLFVRSTGVDGKKHHIVLQQSAYQTSTKESLLSLGTLNGNAFFKFTFF